MMIHADLNRDNIYILSTQKRSFFLNHKGWYNKIISIGSGNFWTGMIPIKF